jgi:hypothetical protein
MISVGQTPELFIFTADAVVKLKNGKKSEW